MLLHCVSLVDDEAKRFFSSVQIIIKGRYDCLPPNLTALHMTEVDNRLPQECNDFFPYLTLLN